MSGSGNPGPSVAMVSNVGNLPLSAFGDLRVSELTPILQGTFAYTVDNTELITKTEDGGADVSQADGMAVISTSATALSVGGFETVVGAHYRPGLGGLMRFTTIFSAPVANTVQYAGLAHADGTEEIFDNGYLIGYDETGEFGFHRFQNDVKISIYLSDWDDPLNGEGPTGITFNPTKLNVFAIQFQYLGGGAIKVYYENSVGMLIPVLTVPYSNLYTLPSVYNPNFLFLMRAQNFSEEVDLVMKCASYAFFVEGKTTYQELQQPSFSTPLISAGSITTETPLFTIRNKSLYASKTNYIEIVLLLVNGSVEASSPNNLANIRLTKNAALGGTPSWSDINTNNSVVEIDTDATSLSGGTAFPILPLAGKNDKLSLPLAEYRFILNPGDTLTISAESANSATFGASLVWRELL